MTPLEINKKIAEVKSLIGDKGVSVSVGDNGRPTNRVAYICQVDDNIQIHSQFKNWAEKISDAWELFEEMPEGSFLEKRENIFICSHNGSTIKTFSTEKTACMAICIEWLKWKGVET